MMKLLACLTLTLPLVWARRLAPRGDPVSYDGYKVVRVNTFNDIPGFTAKIANLTTISFGTAIVGHVDVAIAPDSFQGFEALNIDYLVVREDLGEDIRREGDLIPYTTKTCGLPDMGWFDAYHYYEDHLTFLEDLHKAFPDNSELLDAGESYEGRAIQGIHLWGANGKGGRPAVYWHGTAHAREWVSTMAVEYFTYQLIAGYLEGDEEIEALLDSFDYYILPVVNPDGFAYTQETDRLWRKNRQPRCNQPCVGTDINRNWPHYWDIPGGASTDSCSRNFRGLAPGDTPEMRSLVKFTEEKVVAAHPDGIALYIDFHSYTQMILMPYGGNCSRRMEDYDRQMGLAGGTADPIEAIHGTKYTYGAVCNLLFPSSGSSMDYMLDVAGAKLAWGMELRPLSLEDGGFILPAEEILPTGEENWAGMKYLLQAM